MKKLYKKVCLVLVLGGFSLNAYEPEPGHQYITAIHPEQGNEVSAVIVVYKPLHGTEGSGSHPLLGGAAVTLLTTATSSRTTTLSLENPIDLGVYDMWEFQPTYVSIIVGKLDPKVETFSISDIIQSDINNKSGKWMVNIDRNKNVSFKAAK